jgi:hypothetical protein
VSTMRFNVIDEEGTISLVGPAHMMKMLAAACAKAPSDHRALLDLAEGYDPRWVKRAMHSLDTDTTAETPPALAFRVVDDVTRRRSLEPEPTGLVVYNLKAKRIIQVQNSYADLMRKDRGRLRRDGRPVRAFYWYELPADWSIVP